MYFDDFKVEHIKSPVIQSQDYYPFGMTFNSYQRENSANNQYKFNSNEEQDELGLNVNQAFYRTMDPAIGRWWQVDPKVNDYYQVSPYNMMANNPVNITDPLGDEWADPKKDEKIAAEITAGLKAENKALEKQNARLDRRIDKAQAKGNINKVGRLTSRLERNSDAIQINNSTMDHLEYMGSKGDNVPKFTFETTSGNSGSTDIRGDVIVMTVASRLGSKAHEVSHGWDKAPQGNHNFEEEFNETVSFPKSRSIQNYKLLTLRNNEKESIHRDTDRVDFEAVRPGHDGRRPMPGARHQCRHTVQLEE